MLTEEQIAGKLKKTNILIFRKYSTQGIFIPTPTPLLLFHFFMIIEMKYI